MHMVSQVQEKIEIVPKRYPYQVTKYSNAVEKLNSNLKLYVEIISDFKHILVM